MEEFVNGTKEQFGLLESSLSDRLCHVYKCIFPASFSSPAGRIGFEKNKDDIYVLSIDKGISCSEKATPLLHMWLSEGQLRFLDFNDVRDFFISLKELFQNNYKENRQ